MQLLLGSRQALLSDSESPVGRALPDPARRNRMVVETLWVVRSIATALLRLIITSRSPKRISSPTASAAYWRPRTPSTTERERGSIPSRTTVFAAPCWTRSVTEPAGARALR